jgi:hypothetical protein
VVIRSARIEVATANDLGTTLRHEIAHLALAREALPRWLDEGLSMWASGERLSPAERSLLGAEARSGELPRLDEIEAAFPPHEERAHLAYAESLAFIESLEARFGETRLRALFAAARRAPLEEAFADAFGSPLSACEAEFRRSLAESWSWLRDLVYGASAITVAALVAVVAFVRYRLRRRRALEEMEREASGEEAEAPPSP